MCPISMIPDKNNVEENPGHCCLMENAQLQNSFFLEKEKLFPS